MSASVTPRRWHYGLDREGGGEGVSIISDSIPLTPPVQLFYSLFLLEEPGEPAALWGDSAVGAHLLTAEAADAVVGINNNLFFVCYGAGWAYFNAGITSGAEGMLDVGFNREALFDPPPDEVGEGGGKVDSSNLRREDKVGDPALIDILSQDGDPGNIRFTAPILLCNTQYGYILRLGPQY